MRIGIDNLIDIATVRSILGFVVVLVAHQLHFQSCFGYQRYGPDHIGKCVNPGGNSGYAELRYVLQNMRNFVKGNTNAYRTKYWTFLGCEFSKFTFYTLMLFPLWWCISSVISPLAWGSFEILRVGYWAVTFTFITISISRCFWVEFLQVYPALNRNSIQNVRTAKKWNRRRTPCFQENISGRLFCIFAADFAVFLRRLLFGPLHLLPHAVMLKRHDAKWRKWRQTLNNTETTHNQAIAKIAAK